MNYRLDQTIPTRFEDEYPEEEKILERLVLERNEKCDCGSGRKTKKCCGLLQFPKDPSWWSMWITRLGNETVDLYFDSTMLRSK